MPKLCLITVPGLEVRSDWRLVHDSLLDEFPQVADVLATTMKETILVVYEGVDGGDAGRWLDTVSETILNRRNSRSAREHLTRAGELTPQETGSRSPARARWVGFLK
ncbi:MAG: hypothetical protein JO168_17895 [Solirubrobacterales bacterium]|nr:hypothetical protein [Solirubrobacterales bacterium]MBV9717424.1 hypothetical protein [Solirubrobacterales bacterium]